MARPPAHTVVGRRPRRCERRGRPPRDASHRATVRDDGEARRLEWNRAIVLLSYPTIWDVVFRRPGRRLRARKSPIGPKTSPEIVASSNEELAERGRHLARPHFVSSDSPSEVCQEERQIYFRAMPSVPEQSAGYATRVRCRRAPPRVRSALGQRRGGRDLEARELFDRQLGESYASAPERVGAQQAAAVAPAAIHRMPSLTRPGPRAPP